MKYSVTFIFATALLIIPLLVWLSLTSPDRWQNRLALPVIFVTPSPDTPLYSSGTHLSGMINNQTTLTPADNPVILDGLLQITPAGQLTITAGTKIYARRFAALQVAGRLNLNGTSDSPILITTNEQAEGDQVWSGIMVADSGLAEIKHTALHFASPAVSCLENSRVNLSDSVIKSISLGVYVASANCAINNSTIASTRDGLISRGFPPQLTDTTIIAPRSQIKRLD